MFRMFLLIFRINQDIIDKYDHKCVEVWMKNEIHVIHEHCRSIGYTKWHYKVFVMAITRPKSCLRNVFRLYAYLMIPRSKVDL
ncbi:hypothetical protein Lalb_Chr21g0313641 [Lupinus albus]|uniref:Uncharacterized protein n=1 Tax=Lupinus albus TaxID=3870 RepID=A0A6A4NTJ9_LUPAL|nr:hypothetical protein Lalb_Chr21g0313471 [Lupinus albus]KAE9589868.1 hypothetical protein Lalb_Chr21g0313481 [Lupinus albus]KAE9589884.1 hypothetical protein Lalb_Chr21g0313641 [Lupinus albus]